MIRSLLAAALIAGVTLPAQALAQSPKAQCINQARELATDFNRDFPNPGNRQERGLHDRVVGMENRCKASDNPHQVIGEMQSLRDQMNRMARAQTPGEKQGTEGMGLAPEQPK